MLSNIVKFINLIRSMPDWMAVICVASCVLGPVFILMPFIPGDFYDSESGEQIIREQFWNQNSAWPPVVTGCILILISILALKKVRVLHVIVPCSFLLLAVCYFCYYGHLFEAEVICSLAWVPSSFIYLRYNTKVQKYFSS